MAGSEERPTGRRPGSAPRLTARGATLLVVGVVAVAAAVALRERDLIAVGVLGIALVLLALPLTGLRRIPVRVRHRVEPERLHLGDRGVVQMTLRNPDRRPTRRLEITQPAVAGLMPAVHERIAPLAGGAETVVEVPVTASRRGRHRLPAPRLGLRDPFELWQRRRTLDVTAEVLVLPAVVPLSGLPRGGSPFASTRGGSSTVTTVGGQPDAGVRAYRSGDDPRTIHWRASARLEDDLVVRVSTGGGIGSAVLVLDHRTPRHRALEAAVSLAASVADHLLDLELVLTVTDHTGRTLVTGHDVEDQHLVALVDAGDAGTAIAPTAPGRPDLLVVVAGDLTPAETDTVAHLRRPGVGALALLLTADRAAADVLRETGWRVVVVDPAAATSRDGGEHLAQAWRSLCEVGTLADVVAARGAASGVGAP